MAALQLATMILFPALALFLSNRVKVLGWLGPVGLCYLAGILLANLPGVRLDRQLPLQVAEIVVPVSIPLLLFSAHLGRWAKLSKPLVLGFLLAAVAAVLSAGVLGWLFRGRLSEAWKVAGMLVGVYVGGTSNMTAIGLAVGAKEETFVLVNASDVVVGGAYLLFLLTIAQRLLLRFLPRFPRPSEAPDLEQSPSVWRRDRILPIAGALLAAVGITAASAALGKYLFPAQGVAAVLLLITTLGLLGSLIPRLRDNEGGYELGEFLLLVFCVAIGSLADVRELANANPDLFAMVAAVQFTAIAVHFALCALFRVDADTTLITSTATIFGPAFIGPVARTLKNRELVAGGITTALVGMAVANYLGLSVSWVLRP